MTNKKVKNSSNVCNSGKTTADKNKKQNNNGKVDISKGMIIRSNAKYSVKNSTFIDEGKKSVTVPDINDNGSKINSVIVTSTGKKIKSKAKAAGVKSVFVINDKLIMTGFDNGNKASIEKEVDSQKVIKQVTEGIPKYDAKYLDKSFEITGKIAIPRIDGSIAPISTKLDDNYHYYSDSESDSDNTDLIGMKSTLENRFYGKTFKDNIHIQVIYNILDIVKLMAPQINNIVYSLNSLTRKPIENSDSDNSKKKPEDYIGSGHITSQNNYEDVISNVCPATMKQIDWENSSKTWNEFINSDNGNTRKRLAYFGNLFYARNSKSNKYEIKSEKEIYYILGLVSDVRQYCMHDNKVSDNIDNKIIKDGKYRGRAFLWNLDELLRDDTKKTLDSIFEYKVSQLSREDFAKNGKNTDFAIIREVFGGSNLNQIQLKKLIKEFYEFKIYKSYKNLGFSVKKLREQIALIPDAAIIKSDDYSTVRHKLYGHIDFIIFKYYSDILNTGTGKTLQNNNIVDLLRSCLTEDEKEQVYNNEAETLWRLISNKVKKVIELVTNVNNYKHLKLSDADELVEYVESLNGNVSYFSKLVYMITYLLDGKEINTLCTTLINKFDNIASLNNVMTSRGLENDFVSQYSFFKKSDTIVSELRQVNNMARMSTPLDDVDTQFIMYNEAATVLGASTDNVENLKSLLKLEDKKKGTHDFRNFIINNVIKSRRFLYLIRYVSPEAARKIATDPGITNMVIKDIPDDQIRRYYKSVIGIEAEDLNNARNELGAKLRSVNFKDFENINNKEDAVKKPQSEKAKYMAIVRLYLTIPYLFVKNMVNINARYTLAFNCLERDYLLNKNARMNNNYLILAKEYNDKRKEEYSILEQDYKRNKAAGLKVHTGKMGRLYHQISIIETDMNNTTNKVRIEYRNAIAHLNVISQLGSMMHCRDTYGSYFSAYHYFVQQYLFDYFSREKKENPQSQLINESEQYLDIVNKKKEYSKDFLKALNVPFSYNYPRFKNLSIEALFDKNIEYEKVNAKD